VGCDVGAVEGSGVSFPEMNVGTTVGYFVGKVEGSDVGCGVLTPERYVGCNEGREVGEIVGGVEGSRVGYSAR